MPEFSLGVPLHDFIEVALREEPFVFIGSPTDTTEESNMPTATATTPEIKFKPGDLVFYTGYGIRDRSYWMRVVESFIEYPDMEEYEDYPDDYPDDEIPEPYVIVKTKYFLRTRQRNRTESWTQSDLGRVV